MDTLPPLYLSHGSPMTALEPGAAGAFHATLGPAIDRTFGRPRAILAVSAHTLTREPVLLAAPAHPTVHDFYGFPPELYELRYDAAGAPELARRVAALLADAGLPVHLADEGGLDHGIWTPLRFAWPEADIPILPMGFPPDWTPAQLMSLGRALAPLSAEGVLLMASGSITHNLRMVFAGTAGGRPPVDAPEVEPSAAFRRWFAEHAQAGHWSALADYRRQAPHAALMHPTDEHLLPFYVAAGAAGADAASAAPLAAGVRMHDSVTYGCLGMDAFAFGPSAPRLANALHAGQDA